MPPDADVRTSSADELDRWAAFHRAAAEALTRAAKARRERRRENLGAALIELETLARRQAQHGGEEIRLAVSHSSAC